MTAGIMKYILFAILIIESVQSETEIITKRGSFEAKAEKISLEYVVLMPAKAGKFPAAVVCHPDPRLGGSMDNDIVVAVSRALARAGFLTLRFNFRGVGNSGGSFGNGVGEKSDIRGAIDFLAALDKADDEKLYFAGYSFGSGVGLGTVLGDPRVKAYAGIGCPNDYVKPIVASKTKNPDLPVLFVGGGKDPWCRINEMKGLAGKAG
ncbi:MAG: alpha/beta fold hydrolase, partial [Planctomycetota bacterium]|nr:alpha/beta fold hydrolase [Planctomycetota bacterium]